jgi:hypothetical protein
MTAIAHRDRRHDTLQSSLDASTGSVVGMIVHELRTERLVQILATSEPSGDATVKAADSWNSS